MDLENIDVNKADKSYKKYSAKVYSRRPDVRKKNRAYQRKYYEEHLEQYREYQKKSYAKHRFDKIKIIKQYNDRSCRDPVLGDTVKYNTLVRRKMQHPDLYGDLRVADCLIHVPKIKGADLLSEEQRQQLENKSEE